MSSRIGVQRKSPRERALMKMELDMTPGRYAVQTSGLTKRFGDRIAVDRVDLRVPAGTAFGYLGPNGAGKTTLIRMLLGLTRPDAGSMQLLGHPVPAQRSVALLRVGAMAEEPRFLDHLTGRENLRINAAAREPDAAGRIGPALERVGLSERAGERVAGYSTGMRQRLGVARCLLADPRLLILDEPTNGLDPAGMVDFRGMIRALVDEGRTVVLSSHLLDEVMRALPAGCRDRPDGATTTAAAAGSPAVPGPPAKPGPAGRRAVRAVARALRTAQHEQTRMWEVWCLTSRVPVDREGPLARTPGLDGPRLTGSHLPGPR